MNAIHSKSALLYRQIRQALQSGRFLPGQRIDPAALAAEFETSPTPVRFALYRLVGEGLVADHARSGLHVPLLTEVHLRDLYDWMERLLLMACDIAVTTAGSRKTPTVEMTSADKDAIKLTWKLFDNIAKATNHWSLHRAIKQANDRLAPIRRAKHGLLEDAFDELTELNLLWQNRDLPSLKTELQRYHERRKQLVPQIVAELNEQISHLHQT